MRLGLRGRFVAFVSAIVIAFGVVLTALAVQVQNDRLRSELVEKGKLLTTVISASVTDPLALLEVHELRRLLDEALAHDNLLEATVFGADGRIITDGTVDNPLRHEPIGETARRHVSESDALLVEFAGEEMTVTKAVRIGSQNLGGLRIRYSLAGLVEDQAALARKTALVGAIFALLGVLSAALLTEAVTRPLKEVISATRALSEGQPVPQVPVRTSDEVGQLAEAFNEMTRRLRETTVSRDYLDSVLENMGECLIVTEPDGTINRVNRALCTLVGAEENDLIGRYCGEIIAAPEGYASILHAGRTSGATRGLETDLLAEDGSTVPVLVALASIDSSPGEPKGSILVAADIGERLRIEAQKDDFVTMVHHEVRTPLTAVRGAIGLLDGGVAGDLGDRGRELVAIALRHSERLERLVNDILASRKLESGHMAFHLETVELAPVVEQAIEATAAYGERYNVRFELENSIPEARVTVDPDRLIQVVTNVLSNAVRFSPADEAVTVNIGRYDGFLRIRVTDRGPGISEEFRDRVFEAFAQFEDSDWRHRSGTGLGMNISKAIVEELGGDISFETETGAGTTFFIDLPETQ